MENSGENKSSQSSCGKRGSAKETAVEKLARQAKAANKSLALSPVSQRDRALTLMAAAIVDLSDEICQANKIDMDNARKQGASDAILDRLLLDEDRISAMADALLVLVNIPDPLNRILSETILHNKLELSKVAVPLGLVAMVYEARPNVTADAIGICIKSGNSCILKSGSMALNSSRAIAKIMATSLEEAGLPANCIAFIDSDSRDSTAELLELHGIVDVLIPRGGAGLINYCVENSKVPVIETGTGNCHVYLHKDANLKIAQDVVMNSKTRRYGVCNAAESLIVDAPLVESVLPRIMRLLSFSDIKIHACPISLQLANELGLENVVASTRDDYAREYLAPEISIIVVKDINEAIAHIEKYSTRHSEAIVTENAEAQDKFCREVDSAAVYVNASTAFTDGGQYGMGAEIGISTQKLHVRGPFALEGLCSYKYVVRGNGQVRP